MGSEVPPLWTIQVDFARRKLDVSETATHVRELVSDETEVLTLFESQSLGPTQVHSQNEDTSVSMLPPEGQKVEMAGYTSPSPAASASRDHMGLLHRIFQEATGKQSSLIGSQTTLSPSSFSSPPSFPPFFSLLPNAQGTVLTSGRAGPEGNQCLSCTMDDPSSQWGSCCI